MGLLRFLMGEEPDIISQVVACAREGKGGFGEYLTQYLLEHGRIPGRRLVFRNVLVPRASGPSKTSEVDVLMLHETGIYVFESKNYSGWIFGGADDSQWTQSLKNRHRERFYNPICQNRSHVKALAACLGIPRERFRSYIVFSERCELKKVPAPTGEYVVCKRDALARMLRADLAARSRVFTDEEFGALARRIGELQAASTDEAKAENVEQVRRVADGEVCPRCGRELVRREGKRGPFLGCSGFPQCRYTRDL